MKVKVLYLVFLLMGNWTMAEVLLARNSFDINTKLSLDVQAVLEMIFSVLTVKGM